MFTVGLLTCIALFIETSQAVDYPSLLPSFLPPEGSIVFC